MGAAAIRTVNVQSDFAPLTTQLAFASLRYPHRAYIGPGRLREIRERQLESSSPDFEIDVLTSRNLTVESPSNPLTAKEGSMVKEAETVKTSIKLSKKLWREAHHCALDQGLQLQEIIAKALEAYLKSKGGVR